MVRHRGKFPQPQNLPPALVPVLAVRSNMVDPHLGQLGALGVLAESKVDVGTAAVGADAGWVGIDLTESERCRDRHSVGARRIRRMLLIRLASAAVRGMIQHWM